MKRPYSVSYSHFLPAMTSMAASGFLFCQMAQPALADLSFKSSYNKVQIASVDPATKAATAPVVPPSNTINQVAAASGIFAKKDPFPLSSKFSRRVQRYTGINWVTGVIASEAATIAVHHKLGGRVKVKVKTYSFTDLLAGKVKSLSVDVKEPKLSGVGLGEVSLKSSNPIWYAYRKGKHGERGLQSPVILAVKANLSQKQIARALENPSVSEKLHGLKLDMPGIGEQQLEVIKPKVQIIDDILKLEGTLVTKGGTIESGVPVTISARPLLVGDSKIVLDAMKVDSPDIVEPEKFADFTSKLLNPVFDCARLDRRDHAFRLDSLKVSGKSGVLEGDGHLLLVPKALPVNAQMAQTGGIIR